MRFLSMNEMKSAQVGCSGKWRRLPDGMASGCLIPVAVIIGDMQELKQARDFMIGSAKASWRNCARDPLAKTQFKSVFQTLRKHLDLSIEVRKKKK